MNKEEYLKDDYLIRRLNSFIEFRFSNGFVCFPYIIKNDTKYIEGYNKNGIIILTKMSEFIEILDEVSKHPFTFVDESRGLRVYFVLGLKSIK